MSTEEVFVQQFASLFQQDRETSSPEPERGNGLWDTIPAVERHRLVTAARLAILELETNARMEEDESRRFFAKPGEAEWGCCAAS